MNRNLKSLIQEMDRKTEYKRKSTSIADEGTLIHVGSEGGRQELAMVLKFVKGSQVARPHEDFIVIGTYKYSDIDTQIKINADPTHHRQGHWSELVQGPDVRAHGAHAEDKGRRG